MRWARWLSASLFVSHPSNSRCLSSQQPLQFTILLLRIAIGSRNASPFSCLLFLTDPGPDSLRRVATSSLRQTFFFHSSPPLTQGRKSSSEASQKSASRARQTIALGQSHRHDQCMTRLETHEYTQQCDSLDPNSRNVARDDALWRRLFIILSIIPASMRKHRGMCKASASCAHVAH